MPPTILDNTNNLTEWLYTPYVSGSFETLRAGQHNVVTGFRMLRSVVLSFTSVGRRDHHPLILYLLSSDAWGVFELGIEVYGR